MICIPHQLLLGDEIEKNEMGWTCGTFGKEDSLMGRPEGKKPLETSRRRWEDNIQMDYKSNQQDATIQVNLLFLVSCTCFGRCFRPSSGALDCIYSIW